jgi:hypothetical protein
LSIYVLFDLWLCCFNSFLFCFFRINRLHADCDFVFNC